VLDLSAPNRLCAPSSKQVGGGPVEDPTAPASPEHLNAYPIHTRFDRINNQVISTQFGTVQVDLIRRSFLFVPTAKSLISIPPDLVSPVTDHHQCYSVRRSIGAPRFQRITGVTGVDQFGSHTVDLLRPRYFCAPANKNNEDPGALSSIDSLLCYRTRRRQPFGEQNVFVNDQFLAREVKLIKRWEFCVPSRLVAD
jgi:hypothetical protein